MTRSTVVRLAILFVLLGFVTTPVGADPVTLISRSAAHAGTANGFSRNVRWDQNGRFAVFESVATDLVVGQNTFDLQAFLYDRIAGTIVMISHIPGSPGTGGNGGIEFNSSRISANGKWVAYTSLSTNLVSGQIDANSAEDVFLWNRETDSTVLVSRAVGSAVTAANSGSFLFGDLISADGRYVAYQSGATNLVTGLIPNAFEQIFQFDRVTGTARLVSHAFDSATRAASAGSESAAISGDGRWVSFASFATNHIAGLIDNNSTRDVFLWDRDAVLTSSLRLLSRKQGQPTTTGNGGCDSPAISADGTAVVFLSAATDLEGVTSDTNGQDDAFHYDRPTDVLRLVSHRAGSTTETGNGQVDGPPVVAANGDAVAFQSTSSNVVDNQVDLNSGGSDVFLWLGGAIQLVSHKVGFPNLTGNSASNGPVIAGDGSGVVFSSLAIDLVTSTSDTNTSQDVFLYRPDSGTNRLISHTSAVNQTGSGQSLANSIAVGGAVIGFLSFAPNLVADDNNGSPDVFVHGSLMFADGFEGGDLSSWSVHVP